MLLKENFKILQSLRLGQSTSFSCRKYLQNGEKHGRINQQLRFLRICNEKDVLPKSVQNMKLPGCLNKPQYLTNKKAIQQLTLKKLRKSLFSERANIIKTWNLMQHELKSEIPEEED